MTKKAAIEPGAVFTVRYPFIREQVSLLGPDGPEDTTTWCPGVRFESLPPHGETWEALCDGIGEQMLTVVSAHKPGRFPERVFFTRSWADPAGKSFGKTALRIATAAQFHRLASGYRHEYRLADGASQRAGDRT